MTYVDGFVLPVRTDRKDAYIAMAREVGAVFMDYGALSVMECWGDDVPEGEVTSMSMAVQRKAEETVVFSWIVWPSKDVRDAAHRNAWSDPRLKDPPDPTIMDGKRMIYGGFSPIVEI